MKISNTLHRWWLERLPTIVLVLMALSFISSAYYSHLWWRAYQLNRSYDNQSIIKQPLKSGQYLHAYTVGYLYASHNKPIEALTAFNLAEATADPELRARSKYALANVHFEAAMVAANIEQGGSHRRAVERILLAREAYKVALRIKPDMYDARYNLELLDRLSPPRRTEGYQGSPDGTIGMQPYQQNGSALMKDNTRRGLP